jgi:phosphatidylglycerophosphate synthase
LQIPYQVVKTYSTISGPAFVASTRVLLTARDVQRLIETKSRLVIDGQPASAGFIKNFSGHPEKALSSAPELAAVGVAALIENKSSARAAARTLWASLTSASDGVIDRVFNRPTGRPLSKLLIRTPITPNQISIAATLLGVLAAVGFAVGSYRAAIVAAILLQLSAIIDCVDGDVARVVFKESSLGKWLDIVGDQIVHIGVFVGIGIGLWRAGSSAPVLALAVGAGAGVVLSFAVVMRGLLNPKLQKNTALQRLIDATTNRDFSVLLLGLAFMDRLLWFLWLAAFGVHVFWILALSLQFSRRPQLAA